MIIGILENDPLLSDSLIDYIDIGLGYDVAFCFTRTCDINSKAIATKPGVVLLDANLDDTGGIETIKTVRNLLPDSAIIVITGDHKEKFVAECIENGAFGFLYKPFNLDKLKEAIELVNKKGNYLDQASLNELILTIQNPKATAEEQILKNLTTKELAVFEQVKSGKSVKQIAWDLKVSINTVNFHMKNIYNKTCVNSRSELMSKILNR